MTQKIKFHSEEPPALWEDFMRLGPLAGVSVRVRSGDVEMSPALLSALRLMPDSRPRTLEQWYELCHPADHEQMLELNRALFHSAQTALSLTRRLYCGDGVYRAFRLDACVRREDNNNPGSPVFLMGIETQLEQDDGPSLLRSFAGAVSVPVCLWDAGTGSVVQNSLFTRLLKINPRLSDRLGSLTDGERIECEDVHGRVRTFEAGVRTLFTPDGSGDRRVLSLVDLSENLALEEENMFLRRGLQRYAVRSRCAPDGSPVPVPDLNSEPDSLPVSDSMDMETDKDRNKDKDKKKNQDLDLNSANPDNSAGNDAAAVREELAGCLGSALQALFDSGMTSNAARLQTLLHSLGKTELAVGVVGITSSGKSTFINAMMGERLLPEETRATTNLTVLCRKGGVRAADIFYHDGRIERASGSELTPRWMEERASERLNPGNERGIARIEWSSPGAAIPDGLVLADTPGLDTCDLPRHGDLVLRRLLPGLDIVLYITSIRSRFKVADIELINAVLSGSQKLIILLSQIDLERDDTEAGSVVLSRRQKLSLAMRELKEDLDRAFVPACPVIPISSRLALEKFYDRDSEDWRASNFEPLIRQLSLFRENIVRCGTVLRGKKALNLLERSLKEIDMASQGPAERNAYIQGRSARIRELRDSQRWISAEISSVRNEWGRELSSLPRNLRGESRAALVSRMMERMDRAGDICRQTLVRQGISSAEAVAKMPAFPELPDLSDLSGLSKGDPNGTDRLEALAEVLKDHLNWWENSMRETYCDPLYRELRREEESLDALNLNSPGRKRGTRNGDNPSRAVLRAARERLRENTERIRQLIEKEQPLPELEEPVLPPPSSGGSPEHRVPETGFFTPLIASMREQNLRTRFLSLPAIREAVVRDAQQDRQERQEPEQETRARRLVMLGLRRHDGLRLLSRLVHNAGLSDTSDGFKRLSGADEKDWLFAGRETHLFPSVALPENPDGFEALIAPSDAFIERSGLNWRRLFGQWTPVVHLDLARVDSGLSDLARSPYSFALASVPRWVLAFAHGGLFDNRLSDLVLDVLERVNAFTGLRNFKGRMDWFIYENYDPRYTDFMSMGSEIEAGSNDEDIMDLVDLWNRREPGWRPPFTQERLTFAFKRIRDRLRGNSARLLRGNNKIKIINRFKRREI